MGSGVSLVKCLLYVSFLVGVSGYCVRYPASYLMLVGAHFLSQPWNSTDILLPAWSWPGSTGVVLSLQPMGTGCSYRQGKLRGLVEVEGMQAETEGLEALNANGCRCGKGQQ